MRFKRVWRIATDPAGIAEGSRCGAGATRRRPPDLISMIFRPRQGSQKANTTPGCDKCGIKPVALVVFNVNRFFQSAHFQSKENQSVAEFIKLGPLGAALALSDQAKPIVLLIDELDKGDFDLPNDLLHALDEGRFEIPELQRAGGSHEVAVPQSTEKVPVAGGVVQCRYFPIVVMTSNGEREFPPAFMRRCMPLHIESPSAEALKEIIVKRINPENLANYNELIESFATRSMEKGVTLAIDQLLNAIQLMEQKHLPVDKRAAEQLRIIENLEAN